MILAPHMYSDELAAVVAAVDSDSDSCRLPQARDSHRDARSEDIIIVMEIPRAGIIKSYCNGKNNDNNDDDGMQLFVPIASIVMAGLHLVTIACYASAFFFSVSTVLLSSYQLSTFFNYYLSLNVQCIDKGHN